MTEQDYIDRAEALKQRLYRTALLYLGGEAVALDAVDEAVYRGLRGRQRLRQPEFFATWLTRILINVCNAELRRRKREHAVAEPPETAAEDFDALPLEDDESNTAWLKGLEFYLEDELGSRYEKIQNGISATGSEDSPFYPSHRLESSYFGDAKQLTVYITGARWLDKDSTVAHVDLAGQTAEGLPQGVTLKTAERQGDGVALTFAVDIGREGQFNPFTHTYWDSAGAEYTRDGYSTTGGGDGTGFEVHFFLPDFPGDTVELELNLTRYTAFSDAVAVVVP